jgi:hypothetical protein
MSNEMVETRTIIIRQLSTGTAWTFSWSNNTADSICNLKLPPFATTEDAEAAAVEFVKAQRNSHEWSIGNPSTRS